MLVPEPSAFEVEILIENVKRHKVPGIGHRTKESIQAEVEQFPLRSINVLILFGISIIA
jgi:hypothetical protein